MSRDSPTPVDFGNLLVLLGKGRMGHVSVLEGLPLRIGWLSWRELSREPTGR